MRIGRVAVYLLTLFASFVLGVGTVLTLAPDLRPGRAEAKLRAEVTATLLAEGAFSGMDSIRRATGQAQLLDAGARGFLRLADFSVSNAPHLEVWLSADAGISMSGDVRAATVLRLGPLARTEGEQVYAIPAGTDLSRFRTVLIWCAEFRTLYGTAPLEG